MPDPTPLSWLRERVASGDASLALNVATELLDVAMAAEYQQEHAAETGKITIVGVSRALDALDAAVRKEMP